VSEATRVQNFDAIRITAAASVIFSHAFLIADDHDRNEPLVQLLGKGNILGIFGVGQAGRQIRRQSQQRAPPLFFAGKH
jgi:peptidoglycan/LPS O-acetylase OafA/YrhL